jgi:hypothetical protein
VLYKPSVWNLTYQLKLPKNEKMSNRPVNFQALAEALSKTYQPHNKRQFQAQLDAQFTSDMNTDDPNDMAIHGLGRADFQSTLVGMPPQAVWGGIPKQQNPNPNVVGQIHAQLRQLAQQQHQMERQHQLTSLLSKGLTDLNNFYAVIYRNMSDSVKLREGFAPPSAMQQKVGGGKDKRHLVAEELLRAMETYGLANALLDLDNAYAYKPLPSPVTPAQAPAPAPAAGPSGAAPAPLTPNQLAVLHKATGTPSGKAPAPAP